MNHQLYSTGQRPKAGDVVSHVVDEDRGHVTRVQHDDNDRVIVSVEFAKDGPSVHLADELARVIDIEPEFVQYVETALWSSHGDNGEPLDRDADDIAPESLIAMREDLVNFIESAPADALAFWVEQHGPGQIGHDFWLTRNRHGAGFWDRWAGNTEGCAHGRALTDLAHPYGESDLYIGDDDQVHVS